MTADTADETTTGSDMRPLIVLGTAQFLMVLDSAVMNVSVSQLVEDFDTEVTAIQGVITFYSLVMAATMLIGGKIGDLIGRRRAFQIGLMIYGTGSALTAVAWSVPVLLVGWSVLEGLGAALVLPAMAALVAGNYQGKQRAFAYGVLGGLAGTGVAIGPIVGGFFTANLSWRYVFVGEALIVVVMLALLSWITEPPAPAGQRIDGVGALLSMTGLGLVVIAALQSGSWGWFRPRNSPIEPFGLALTPFVFGAGVLALWGFSVWERWREERELPTLVRLALLSVPQLRGGLSCLFIQNVALLGLFFSLPLYLQITQGLDALETGIRLLPMSVLMMIFSLVGTRLVGVLSARAIVRIGFGVVATGALVMVGTIEPELDELPFAFAMGSLGVGMGLLASQLGNVVQSAVGEDDRSEAGGLQYTSLNLGAAFGTALVGSIVLGSLATAFTQDVQTDERVSAEVSEALTIELQAGVAFVSTAEVEAALGETDIPTDEVEAIVESYADSQLDGLRIGILVMAGVALLGLFPTHHLPSTRNS